MESIFSAKLNARVRPNDILVKTHKSATFGDKSLATSPAGIYLLKFYNRNTEQGVKYVQS